MSNRSAFWSTVDEELDARRDPLASATVRSWLLEHPEDALELADVRAALRALEGAQNPLLAPRRARRVPLAAAAAGLLAVGALGLRLAIPPPSALEDLARHPVVSRPDLGSVQSWELVSTVEMAGGMHALRASAGRVHIEDREVDLPSTVECMVLSSESVVMR